LLQNRRREIDTALEAVAPEETETTLHAALLGEQNSGRSSVLAEVARRAIERERLIVRLQLGDGVAQGGRRIFLRHMLTAIVEALASKLGNDSPWYRAWRDRVYLRSTAPAGEHDVLSSALVLAADPDAEIDRAVLERDLAALSERAVAAGLRGVVLCVDDASPLTEDVPLIEELVDVFDIVGGYSLLLAGLPEVATHFTQAASPCLDRCTPVWLRPFRGPHQIFNALSTPLGVAAQDFLQAEDVNLLRDVLELTSGNPYELMVVGHYLWLSCHLGEQDAFALTPRVLDRVIPALSRLTTEGDALLDGAHAIDRLPEGLVRQAVELSAFSRLSIREIAIARLLKVGGDSSIRLGDEPLGNTDIEGEVERVRGDLEQLENAGVIQLHGTGERFSVIGGRPASVLLKYKARARIGAEASGLPFQLNFTFSVGDALARDAMLRTLDLLPEGASSLGFSAVMAQGGGIGRLSPRPAIRSLAATGGISRLVEAEVDLLAWGTDAYERTVSLIDTEDLALVLVCTSLGYGRDTLDHMELWQVPATLTQEELEQAVSGVIEQWEPVVRAADLSWGGTDPVVLHGAMARKVLFVLQPFAARSAIHRLFRDWMAGSDDAALHRARRIANEAVATIRETGRSDVELVGELSEMLSCLGFLESFDDDSLDEATTSLDEALAVGDADGWVTHWNLTNVLARRGRNQRALEQLDLVSPKLEDWSGSAWLLFYVPDQAPVDCLLEVTETNIAPLLELQRLLLDSAPDRERLLAVVDECRACESDGTERAVSLVEPLLASLAS
jgi:hypothetical protein